jgi:hypothetical protein
VVPTRHARGHKGPLPEYCDIWDVRSMSILWASRCSFGLWIAVGYLEYYCTVECWLDEVSDVDAKTSDLGKQSLSLALTRYLPGIDAVSINQKPGQQGWHSHPGSSNCVLVLRLPETPSKMTPFRLTIRGTLITTFLGRIKRMLSAEANQVYS